MWMCANNKRQYIVAPNVRLLIFSLASHFGTQADAIAASKYHCVQFNVIKFIKMQR